MLSTGLPIGLGFEEKPSAADSRAGLDAKQRVCVAPCGAVAVDEAPSTADVRLLRLWKAVPIVRWVVIRRNACCLRTAIEHVPQEAEATRRSSGSIARLTLRVCSRIERGLILYRRATSIWIFSESSSAEVPGCCVAG